MKLNAVIGLLISASLIGCESGDVVLQPTNVDNSGGSPVPGTPAPATPTPNAPTPTANPCARYEAAGQTFQGTYSGGNCTYTAAFVSDSRPLQTNLFIPALAENGIHIFQDSLWMGDDVDANAAVAGRSIPQAGDGPDLTIEAGARVAFSAADSYLRIARGSRLIAEGTAEAPIVLSAVADLRDASADPEDRGLWGGVQINGNGITNKCTDAQRLPTGGNPHNCHITAEGRPGTYGGANNAESSGTLQYVVIKHAGYDVVEGNELNALTLNAVGSGTTIEYVQTYSTFDDGFEMFGGAVNLKNIVAVNVGDDAIDFSEGYLGSVQYALVVQPYGANNCVEGDNGGENRADDVAPFTKLRISNMTCITSNVDRDTGDVAPSPKGDSEGALFREGAHFEMYNSVITSLAEGAASNECLELDDSEGPQTIAAAIAGISVASSNLIACTEPTKEGVDASNAEFTTAAWLQAEGNANNVVVAAAGLPANLFNAPAEGGSYAYVTSAQLTDATSAAIEVTPYDVTCLEDDFDANAAPATTTPDEGESICDASSFFDAVDFIGAVGPLDNWVEGWTVGL